MEEKQRKRIALRLFNFCDSLAHVASNSRSLSGADCFKLGEYAAAINRLREELIIKPGVSGVRLGLMEAQRRVQYFFSENSRCRADDVLTLEEVSFGLGETMKIVEKLEAAEQGCALKEG